MINIAIDYEAEELPTIEITFESGTFAGKTFRSTLEPCSIQTCECGNIYVDFELVTPDQENEESDELEAQEDILFSGQLNVNENQAEIYPNDFDFGIETDLVEDSMRVLTTEEAFASQLNQELTAEDWQTLDGFFIAMKTVGSEIVDPEQIIAEFNRYDVEQGLPIGYNDVFPYALPESMKMGETFYTLNDAYCLKNNVNLNEVSLIISPVIEEKSEPTNQHILEEEPALLVKYNYITKDIQLLQEFTGSLHTTEELLNTLRGLEDVTQRFRERHQRMRKIYQNYLKRLGLNANPKKMLASRNVSAPAKLAGRNDPCPCGSGKKYKKCCGA